MKILISERLQNLFLLSHKNLNYSLNFLLSSIDLDTCPACVKLVKEFVLLGNRVEVEIDDSNVQAMQRIFGNIENTLVEQLLWISILFPEI